MKIKANDYKDNEIIRIVREWTELTQKQFGFKQIAHRDKPPTFPKPRRPFVI
jgi:hypothetical protein